MLVATLVSPIVLRRLLARGDGVEGDDAETRRAEAAPAAVDKAPP